MDLRALKRNFKKSATLCRSPKDRLKYLYWLYRSALPFRSPRLVIGFRLSAPPGKIELTVRANAGSDAFIFSEVFEHRYYDFPLNCAPLTILDVGANIGLTAVFFARKYPGAELACVEPVPQNVSLLRENLERNRVVATVYAKALAVSDAPVIMKLSEKDYGHNIAKIEFGPSTPGKTIDAPGISVPTLMSQLSWTKIDLMKIDIEGYEGLLLRDNCDWLNAVGAICIECHEGFGKADLAGVAAEYGFEAPRQLAGIYLLTRKHM
jgi:FkbM family methyltransferase